MHRLGRRFSYSSRKVVLNAITECDKLSQVKRVHARIVATGFDQCSVVQAKLVRKLTELGIPLETYAQLIFDRVKNPNPFLWTALIRGYALEGHLSVAVEFYCRMRWAGCTLLSFTFSALFKACGGAGNVILGRELHGQMVSIGGFETDVHAGNSLIDMYVKSGHLDCARKVFDEMRRRDAVSWTELIVAYGKSGDMETARVLLEESPAKEDAVAWTAMVAGYAQNGRPGDALASFERMRESGVAFDDVTLTVVISACASLGASKYAKWIHVVAETSGFGPRENVFVGSALVDMHSKCGSLGDALAVFGAMRERNVFSYSAMIAGLATHGRARAAVRLFRRMVGSGVRPNGATFVGLLAACSHAGLVGPGKELFAAMEGRYGVAPVVEHYSCLVDLLGRAGRLEEATAVVEAMPVEPNAPVWGALLAACRARGDAEGAAAAAGRLFEIEPGAAANYVALASVYASAGMWDRVSRVRELIMERRVKKNPGASWVETRRGEIRQFFSGDSTDGIDRTPENLVGRLGAHEYCHADMCGASRIARRDIVVRDSTRFHHFRNGTCSCGLESRLCLCSNAFSS